MEFPIQTLLHRAAFAVSHESAWIRVTGEDRARWLNGMTTNSIAALQPGEGCYTFFLNAQGKIQGDATAFLLPESILLRTAASQVHKLIETLDRFIIMDDVELFALPARPSLLLAGPDAPKLLSELGVTPPSPLHLVRTEENGVDAIAAFSPLVPRFELLGDERLPGRLATVAAEVPIETFEQLRLLEGTPKFGVDIREKELPQETAQTRALHFAKGCYLGQEIVERIRSRGNLHRTFAGFVLEGELPLAGTAIAAEEAPEKPIGELTSSGRIELGESPIQLGLGYIRREALDRKATLVYPGGRAIPAELPYRKALSA
jgi:aminomethyltransferase